MCVANIFPVLLADLTGEDVQRRVIAAEELLLYQDHLQTSHVQRLVPEFRQLLLADLELEQDAQLCAAAAAFFAPLAEVFTLHRLVTADHATLGPRCGSAEALSEARAFDQVEVGSVEHPSESTNEAAEEARPQAGWVASLLEWGAVPPLISLMNWAGQASTTPWPGAYAAAGKSMLMPHVNPLGARCSRLVIYYMHSSSELAAVLTLPVLKPHSPCSCRSAAHPVCCRRAPAVRAGRAPEHRRARADPGARRAAGAAARPRHGLDQHLRCGGPVLPLRQVRPAGQAARPDDARARLWWSCT